jgi:hypothetical protein
MKTWACPGKFTSRLDSVKEAMPGWCEPLLTPARCDTTHGTRMEAVACAKRVEVEPKRS